jgi:hypothetical protein
MRERAAPAGKPIDAGAGGDGSGDAVEIFGGRTEYRMDEKSMTPPSILQANEQAKKTRSRERVKSKTRDVLKETSPS